MRIALAATVALLVGLALGTAASYATDDFDPAAPLVLPAGS